METYIIPLWRISNVLVKKDEETERLFCTYSIGTDIGFAPGLSVS